MDEIKFGELQNRAFKLTVDTFNKPTLRRSLTSKAAIKHLNTYDTQIKALLNNDALSQKQYYQLQNDVANIKSQYTTKVTTQDRIIKNEKAKAFKKQVQTEIKKNEALKQQQIKSQVQTTSKINANVSDVSKNTLAGLIRTAEKVAGVAPTTIMETSTSTTVAKIPTRPDKINFNLKGFALIQDIAQNSVQHGYLDSDIDKGLQQNKISASEAKNIKTFFNKANIKPQVAQIGEIGKAKQFYSPQFQKAFNTFLQTQYNEVFTKMPKDVTPKEGSSKSKTSFTDKFTKKLRTGASMGVVPTGGGGKSPMQEALGMYDPFNKPGPYMNKGGRVPPKRKPYAIGGKVYGNSVRKPKFK